MNLNLSDKARSIIGAIAPTLGTALGGPLGGLAGNVIAAAIGGKDSKAVEDALLTQDPQTLLALRKGEQDFVAKMEELGISREQLAVQDRVSARDMAKVNMKPQMMLSALFIGGYFTIIALMVFGLAKFDDADRTNLTLLLGVLTAGIPQILAFWFGSTAGSANKTALLAASKPANAP